ncbi:hypothetical protein [Sandarakinorhabdus sp. DWP1-3-1]|uniref:hypothetical protein n=1 Tax=Sandarakinorhabdus sp. DWP1-3-1 TaxID=2804627 RepID=UPI003CF4A3DF
MNPFEMVVLIVAIVTVGRVASAKYGVNIGGGGRKGRRMEAMQAQQVDDVEAARLRAEVTRLNDRIQVLERLATDPAKRLSDEIDALKNQ